MWMSEWHTPQKRISICTSFGLSSRRSIWKGARGVVGPWAAYALVTGMSLGLQVVRRSSNLTLNLRPSSIGKNDRRLDLSFRDWPVRLEKAVLVLAWDESTS